jgi:hypothetical protein
MQFSIATIAYVASLCSTTILAAPSADVEALRSTAVTCEFDEPNDNYPKGMELGRRHCLTTVANDFHAPSMAWSKSSNSRMTLNTVCGGMKWQMSRKHWKSADNCAHSCMPCMRQGIEKDMSGARCVAKMRGTECQVAYWQSSEVAILSASKPDDKPISQGDANAGYRPAQQVNGGRVHGFEPARLENVENRAPLGTDGDGMFSPPSIASF